ncbi:NusA antitermination factor [Peptoclostridium litorale DSM 5388]|uniref:Transcription termination/antitermination protein NusA n=1 Tax=Peptoclostridium litorale DSM 5388 TaxID=1121324 RepID=A0A069RDQ9_PEPLI|nr:transcription termination factor NusA [Peptoclostridium litorale]KDR95204.1 transcription termination/antitermination protein NusA [Peptoclostridium litorale DSM 5388]SIN73417.1 NusA antitermination factor [Peptoclostridium litorale DSM 5388]
MNAEFIYALDQIEKEKGVSKEILIETIEAALVSAYKKNFGSSQNVKIKIDRETGDVRVFAEKLVVEQVEDRVLEVSLEEAQNKYGVNVQVDDIVEEEVTPKDFGRIAAQNAKQVVVQRIKEAERDVIFNEFTSRESEIITGVVARVTKGVVYVALGKTEGVLNIAEQIPGEDYQIGQRIKAYILEVKKTTKGPQIFLSRSHPGLVKRLFELEVPEIYDGVVRINSVAREAGSRTKIAVESLDENVDPVGSCVGPKGIRVKNIVDELDGEKIDIIKYNEDMGEYISNSLSPSKVVSVDVDENEKSAKVVVPDYQLSLAIGKEGQNARLAAKLTNWKIDIKSESQIENVDDQEREKLQEAVETVETVSEQIDETVSEQEI